jgi:GNAT superfamily N-acetyltransferase
MSNDAAPFSIRDATQDDIEILQRAGYHAMNWNPSRPRLSPSEIAEIPILLRYLDDWMRESDLGVVATDRDGAPIGACWLRFFTEAEPGYGFVSEDIPEIAIGIEDKWRGKGVGRALLRALADRARAAGITKLCLAVEQDNFAANLYRSEGFVDVRSGDGDFVMVKTL